MTKAFEKVTEISECIGWFGEIEDFADYCEDAGLDVLELNRDYAVVVDDEGNQCEVAFGGTENTIVIFKIENC